MFLRQWRRGDDPVTWRFFLIVFILFVLNTIAAVVCYIFDI